ncbi:homeobox protein HEX homolog pha-2 [Wyeomyia smithii]|uniref:homeobox protein HEX homolog pha-2 n=1 Tax=Wyeomyia smithii TaxID=174621 RepID=UPI002467D6DA|nr:homeobox protein HEX homolog pha-2 [Wyeomyia smithii]
MEMGSSKRKSSFRIDDILHQQAEQQQMLFHHQQQLVQNSVLKQLSDLNAVQPSSSTSPLTTTDYCSTQKSPSNSPVAIQAGRESPKKPTALYPNLLEFQKTSFPLHLQFGMPSFNPALSPALNAAYLEHYANVLHKASPRLFPFYPPHYSYLLPPCGSKRKGGQVRFTPQQTQNLERRFSNHKYLSPEDRRHLAVQLKLSDRQVKTWFQNRRAKWRRANVGSHSSESPVDMGENVSKNSNPLAVTSTVEATIDPMKKYSNDYNASSNSEPAELYDSKNSDNYSEHESSSEAEDSCYEDGSVSSINVI